MPAESWPVSSTADAISTALSSADEGVKLSARRATPLHAKSVWVGKKGEGGQRNESKARYCEGNRTEHPTPILVLAPTTTPAFPRLLIPWIVPVPKVLADNGGGASHVGGGNRRALRLNRPARLAAGRRSDHRPRRNQVRLQMMEM